MLVRLHHSSLLVRFCPFFFFTDTATTEIYTLSLHDALPIFHAALAAAGGAAPEPHPVGDPAHHAPARRERSEEHTSELQSHSELVCRLLLEKKKTNRKVMEVTISK